MFSAYPRRVCGPLGQVGSANVNDIEIYCRLFRAEFHSLERQQYCGVSEENCVNNYTGAYRVEVGEGDATDNLLH